MGVGICETVTEEFWKRVCWKMDREKTLWCMWSGTEDFQMG